MKYSIQKFFLSLSCSIFAVASVSHAQECPGMPSGFKAIRSSADLYAINRAFDASYFLCADIQLGLTRAAVIPVFAGLLEGNGHIIKGLTIASNGKEASGLIGVNRGKVRNLRLESFTIASLQGQATGALAGLNASSGEISSVRVTSSIVRGPQAVGGLVGSNSGLIKGSQFAGKILASAPANAVANRNNFGGLAGSNSRGRIAESSSSASIDLGINEAAPIVLVGGLVGSNQSGTILQSFATGIVTAHSLVGGLVGSNSNGLVDKSVSTGAVRGVHSVGGLAGAYFSADEGPTRIALSGIFNSWSSSSVVASQHSAGGLVGEFESDVFWAGSISKCSAFGDVAVTVKPNTETNVRVGGLVGSMYGNLGIADSEVYSKVHAAKNNTLGVGTAFGYIRNWTGTPGESLWNGDGDLSKLTVYRANSSVNPSEFSYVVAPIDRSDYYSVAAAWNGDLGVTNFEYEWDKSFYSENLGRWLAPIRDWRTHTLNWSHRVLQVQNTLNYATIVRE